MSRLAHASPFTVLGYDAESSAVAASNATYGSSPGVAFVNPAALVDVPNGVEFGITMFTPRFEARLEPRPRGADVPLTIYDSDVGRATVGRDRALPTRELPSARSNTATKGESTFLAIGGAYDFGFSKFKLGFVLQLPVTSQNTADTSTNYADEREAAFSNRLRFTRFGGWDTLVALVIGAAYQPTDWLSVGVGGELTAAAVARVRAYIPDAAVQSYANTNLEAQVSIGVRPTIGVRLAPTHWLAFGLSYRAEGYYRVDGASDITLWNYHEADNSKLVPKRTTQQFSFIVGYEPAEFSVGVGARSKRLTGQINGRLQRYSKYLDSHAQHPEEVARLPDGPTTFDPNEYRFRDVLSVQAGAQWRYIDRGELSLGAAYYPSPVPAQTGRTNYVDNDLLGFAAGSRFDFKLSDKAFSLIFTFQYWHMLPRTTYKIPSRLVDEMPDSARALRSNELLSEAAGLQTNNPGFPGYRATGALVSWGLSVKHSF